ASLQTAIETAFGSNVRVDITGNDLTISSNSAITIGGATTNGGGFLDGQNGVSAGNSGANDDFTLTIDGNTNTFNIDLNTTLDDLVSAINNDATNGLKDKVVAENDNGTLKLTAKDDSTTFTIGGDANVVSALNLTAGDVAPDTAGENNVLAITVGGAAASFRIGTSNGEVNTLTDLVNAINNNDDISGLVKASNENGQLKLEAKFADDDITLGGTADVSKFGLQAGPSNTVRNLLAQNAVTGGSQITAVSKEIGPGATALSGSGNFANGDTIDVTVNGVTSTLAFNAADGAGNNGQFNTLDGLAAELNNLGLTASVVDDRLSVTSSENGSFSFEVNTAANAAATIEGLLGIKDGFNYSKDSATGNFSTDTTDAASGYSYTSGTGEQTLSIQVGNRPATEIKFGHGAGRVSTFDELQEALSNLVGGTASIDASGNITVEADEYGDDVTVQGTADLKKFGLTAGTFEEKTSSTRTQLQDEFNSLRQQIDQLSKDSSFNGVNLLNGDSLTVTFNEDGSSNLEIGGVTFDASNLGISEVAGDGFQSNGSINAALKELDNALTSLRTQASVFGSKLSNVEIRQDFTKGLSNVLETGAANLTLADTNEEGANMLALQTRQTLSTTALSLASQADQNVLRLF
ncbi:MAG: hypothetical protein KDI98_08280, partial [Hyphomicrobiaceae bacterium]|nr:hypothetical protein [Hyphomicrobiaceae bacterium]